MSNTQTFSPPMFDIHGVKVDYYELVNLPLFYFIHVMIRRIMTMKVEQQN